MLLVVRKISYKNKQKTHFYFFKEKNPIVKVQTLWLRLEPDDTHISSESEMFLVIIILLFYLVLVYGIFMEMLINFEKLNLYCFLQSK